MPSQPWTHSKYGATWTSPAPDPYSIQNVQNRGATGHEFWHGKVKVQVGKFPRDFYYSVTLAADPRANRRHLFIMINGLHRASATSDSFDVTIGHLLDTHRCDVLRVDSLGMGQSDNFAKSSDLDDDHYVNAIMEAIKSARAHFTAITWHLHILGHSAGGFAAVKLADSCTAGFFSSLTLTMTCKHGRDAAILSRTIESMLPSDVHSMLLSAQRAGLRNGKTKTAIVESVCAKVHYVVTAYTVDDAEMPEAASIQLSNLFSTYLLTEEVVWQETQSQSKISLPFQWYLKKRVFLNPTPAMPVRHTVEVFNHGSHHAYSDTELAVEYARVVAEAIKHLPPAFSLLSR